MTGYSRKPANSPQAISSRISATYRTALGTSPTTSIARSGSSLRRRSGKTIQRRLFASTSSIPASSIKSQYRIALVANGEATGIPFSTDLFAYGEGVQPPKDTEGAAFSGFRVRYPINSPGRLPGVRRLSGCELFPGGRPRTDLRPFGARARCQHGGAGGRRVSSLPAVLD